MEEENAFLALLALVCFCARTNFAVGVTTFTDVIRPIRIEVTYTRRRADLILHVVICCARYARRGGLLAPVADLVALVAVIDGSVLHGVPLAVVKAAVGVRVKEVAVDAGGAVFVG